MSDEAGEIFGVTVTADGRITDAVLSSAVPGLGQVGRSQSIVFEPGVRVFRDGRVEIAAGVTLDEAALGFWRAVEMVFPVYLKKRTAESADEK